MPVFVLLHGLPGSGKTTAAKSIVKQAPEQFFFVDWGGHPEFGKKSARELLSTAYVGQADGRSMVSEGVLEERKTRDRLITAVIAASQTTDFPLDDGIAIFIDEPDMTLLAERRSKSADFYGQKRNAVELGSDSFRWVHYAAAGEPPQERAERLLELIRA
jgi:adenylate kinase family enzyme